MTAQRECRKHNAVQFLKPFLLKEAISTAEALNSSEMDSSCVPVALALRASDASATKGWRTALVSHHIGRRHRRGL